MRNYNSVDWKDLSGSEQAAVEYAYMYIESDHDTIEEAVRRACMAVDWGNAEPEYEDEEFYEEEADPKIVELYILQDMVNNVMLDISENGMIDDIDECTYTVMEDLYASGLIRSKSRNIERIVRQIVRNY